VLCARGSFAEVAVGAFGWHLRATSPVTRIDTHANETVKRRIAPLADLADEPMLDRMDVIDMLGNLRMAAFANC